MVNACGKVVDEKQEHVHATSIPHKCKHWNIAYIYYPGKVTPISHKRPIKKNLHFFNMLKETWYKK